MIKMQIDKYNPEIIKMLEKFFSEQGFDFASYYNPNNHKHYLKIDRGEACQTKIS